MTDDAGSRATSSTFVRYLRFQAPGTVVVAVALVAGVRFDLVDLPAAGGVLCLWIAKDLALYPLLRSAYEPSGGGYPSRLVGSAGRARADLAPRGYVSVAGELWRAECIAGESSIRAGERVVVVGTVGSRLLVRRDQGADTDRST